MAPTTFPSQAGAPPASHQECQALGCGCPWRRCPEGHIQDFLASVMVHLMPCELALYSHREVSVPAKSLPSRPQADPEVPTLPPHVASLWGLICGLLPWPAVVRGARDEGLAVPPAPAPLARVRMYRQGAQSSRVDQDASVDS